MTVHANGKVYKDMEEFAEQEFDIPWTECTPEWNIAHYTKLLSYTKHTVRRKKLQAELNWWLEMQEVHKEAVYHYAKENGII